MCDNGFLTCSLNKKIKSKKNGQPTGDKRDFVAADPASYLIHFEWKSDGFH